MARFGHDLSANAKAASALGKIIAVLIILAVTGLGDVMYIQLMQNAFPSGFLLVLCYFGAFASFLAMAYLLIGKTISFRPGAQTIAAWALLVVELLIATLNIMLVFTGVQHVSGFLAVWLYLAPATPVLIMSGVLIVFFLDPELKAKHEDMEMQDNINRREREYVVLQHEAEMKIKREGLKLTEGFLMEEMHDASNLEIHRGIASQMYGEILSGFAGVSIAPRKNVTRFVSSHVEHPVSLAQTAQQTQTEAQREFYARGVAAANAASEVPTRVLITDDMSATSHEQAAKDFHKLAGEDTKVGGKKPKK